MPLDPQVKALLAELEGSRPMHDLSVEVVRKGVIERERAKTRRATPGIASTDLLLDTALRRIPARLYRPDTAGELPLLVFFHGSGFVIHNLDSHDELCRHLCARSGWAVLSVDYRLAPEHPFPAAVDDCLEATRWAERHAGEIACNPACIVVGGDSAGGNLAAVTCLRVRDEGGPALRGQSLIYPVTDYHTPATRSYVDNALGYGMTRADMIWFWGHYLPDPAAVANPHACPLRAPRLSDLPPALVITAEYDPLRDEGEAYAQRLRAQGVEVEYSCYDGMNHGFMRNIGSVDRALDAIDEACGWLISILAPCNEPIRSTSRIPGGNP